MATQRRKFARGGKGRQAGKAKERPKSRTKPLQKKAKAKDVRPKRAAKPAEKKSSKASTKSVKGKKASTPAKPRKKKSPKWGKLKSPAPKAAIRGKVQIPKAFVKLRSQAKKADKLPSPSHPKRRGKTTLRGTRGQERSIVVGLPWENVKEGWLLHAIERAFLTMVPTFKAGRPSMYVRFTFTVTRVMSLLSAGSPKLIRATKKRVKAWFVSSGLSYTLEGVKHQVERAIDTIGRTIEDAEVNNDEPEFFLEFLTCIAYQVAS
jgi:hypothetical protein